MTTNELPHRLERTIDIDAPASVVFDFLSDSAYWAQWWGEGSTIDPTPGGDVLIRHPNGIEVRGEVLEIEASRRIVFSYGFVSGSPIPVGRSRVQIDLDDGDGVTRLRLVHSFADAAARDEHVQGWRYQLSVFSNVVADRVHVDAGERADAWFAVWVEADEDARRSALERLATPDVRYRDRFSCLDGIDDVMAHIGASIRFMPGLRLTRDGDVRQCQGWALADWIAAAAGETRGRGTTVFHFKADGRIDAVTGFR